MTPKLVSPLSAKKNAKVYISGPMSGKENHNRQAFFEAQQFLKAWDYVPVNPHVLNEQLTEQERQEYSVCLKSDFKELLTCDAIYMLRGWQYSNGARKELDLACTISIPVFFEVGN